MLYRQNVFKVLKMKQRLLLVNQTYRARDVRPWGLGRRQRSGTTVLERRRAPQGSPSVAGSGVRRHRHMSAYGHAAVSRKSHTLQEEQGSKSPNEVYKAHSEYTWSSLSM